MKNKLTFRHDELEEAQQSARKITFSQNSDNSGALLNPDSDSAR